VSGNFGTARLGTWADLIRGKLTASNTGLIMGRLGLMPPATRWQAIRALCSPFVDSESACRMVFSSFLDQGWGDDGFMRINDFTHLLTCAPAGGGKSVSTLVPNLLTYVGNCVVLDKGGELYKLTAKHRRKRFGHETPRIDPASLMGPGADSLNILDWVKPNRKEFIGQSRDLANMTVARTGLEHEVHFLDSAENVIAAMFAYVAAAEGDPAARNLRGVRTQLASRANYDAAVERLQQMDGFDGVLADLGQSMTWHVDRERGSVMSTVQRCTHIFGDPLVDEATWRTSFDLAKLRHGRMTLYIVIPPDRMVVWSPLIRVLLGSIIRMVTPGVPTEKSPVLFMVDEVAHIGRIQALEDAITLLRGSGLRIWLFVQSLDQLNKCFGDHAPTVLDNLGTQQYMGITSHDTCDQLSKKMGDETIVIRTAGGNAGTSTSTGGQSNNISESSGTSDTISETSRPLFKPEEIRTLPSSVSLLFHKNNYVILCELIKYYADEAFRYRWWRGYGTGQSRGLGLSGALLALAALLLSGVVTAFVATLPVPARQRPGEPGWQQPRQVSPYRPGLRQSGRRPLPYRRVRRFYP
jgi:type IV secretion system protein VirD4